MTVFIENVPMNQYRTGDGDSGGGEGGGGGGGNCVAEMLKETGRGGKKGNHLVSWVKRESPSLTAISFSARFHSFHFLPRH